MAAMISAQGGGRRARAGAVLVALLISIAATVVTAPVVHASGHWLGSSSSEKAGDLWTQARVREARPLELKPDRAGASVAETPAFGSDFEQVADPTTPEFRIHGVILLSLGIFGYG